MSSNWSAPYRKRIKLLIDHTKVTSSLINYPLQVFLHRHACIFNELGDLYTKLSIRTSSDVACYVEVAEWDSINARAVLWVNVPNVSATVDTALYLYYDKLGADNNTYVGLQTSSAAKQVWDSNHVGVWHFNNTTSLLDSTPLSNHGTFTSITSTNLTTIYRRNKGIFFDATNDYATIPHNAAYNLTSNFEVEYLVYPTENIYYIRPVLCKGYSNYKANYAFGFQNQTAMLEYNSSTSAYAYRYSTATFSLENLYHLCFKLESGNINFYINGILSSSTTVGTLYTNTEALYVAADFPGGDEFFGGNIYELKISNIVRSPAWTLANYHALMDNIVSFGFEELKYKPDYTSLKYLKLTLDKSFLTEALTAFPFTIYLDKKYRDIFDTVGSNYNKIYIVYEGQRCYAEVADWDITKNIATLFVCLPYFSPTSDSYIYIYYGSAAVEDYIFIGTAGSIQAKSVWDKNFIAVFNFFQKTGTILLDSSYNTINGTLVNFSDVYRDMWAHCGQNTNGYFFNPSTPNNYINVGAATEKLLKPDYISVEAICYILNGNSAWARIFDRSYAGGQDGYALDIYTTGPKARFELWTPSGQIYADTSTVVSNTDNWLYLVGVYQTGTAKIYVNGLLENTTVGAVRPIDYSSSPTLQARIGDGVNDSIFKGYISSIRLSNMERSSSWIKATYYTQYNLIVKAVDKALPKTYNISVAGEKAYLSTASGIKVKDIVTEADIAFLPVDNTSAVWVNDSKIYVGTTTSGIQFYNKDDYTYIESITTPVLMDNNISYLHGSGDYLCAATLSGISWFDFDNLEKLNLPYKNTTKCFQTSVGSFYYTVNDQDYSSLYEWNYKIEIIVSEELASENEVIIQVPKNLIWTKCAPNGGDIRFVNRFGKNFEYNIISLDFNDLSIFKVYNISNSSLFMLFGNSQIATSTLVNTSNVIMADFSSTFPAKIWREVSINYTDDISFVKHYDNKLLFRVYSGEGSTAALRTPYLSGRVEAVLDFTMISSNYYTPYLQLRLVGTNGYSLAITTCVNGSGLWFGYQIGSGPINYFSPANTGTNGKFKLIKNHNNVVLQWMYHTSTSWQTYSSYDPLVLTGFDDSNMYFEVSLVERANAPTMDTIVNSFSFKAESIVDTNTYTLSDVEKSGQSALRCISNTSLGTLSHEFTSNEAFINKFNILDMFKLSTINDIYITEKTAQASDNVVFIASNVGVSIIEESSNNYMDSAHKFYLLDT